MDPAIDESSDFNMRIVHIINSVGYGGAERQLSLLASEISKRGVDQTIVTLYSASRIVELGPGLSVKAVEPGRIGLFRAWFWTIGEARKSDPSVIVAWMYHSWGLAFLALPFCRRRTKLVLYCRHGDLQSLRGRTKLIASACLHLARWWGVPVVFNSFLAEREHRELCGRIVSHVIPNGVDIPAASDSVRMSRRPAFGFLGRNHPHKGADCVAAIVRDTLVACPEWDFVIAGPKMSEREKEITSLAVDAGVDKERISITDTINDHILFFSKIDILIVPSRTESFPNVVVEAMAASVLVAATSVGDIPEILDSLVPVARDPSRVAATAIGLAELPAHERVRIGVKLAAIALERYAIERVADLHLSVWNTNR